jgi:hypothetical protein
VKIRLQIGIALMSVLSLIAAGTGAANSGSGARPWSLDGQMAFVRMASLETSAVTAIAQDTQGFLWFGAQSNLLRWDGYRLHTYARNPDAAGSLPDNFIRSLLVDDRGQVWDGAFILEPGTDTPRRLLEAPGSGDGPSRRGESRILDTSISTETSETSETSEASETMRNFTGRAMPRMCLAIRFSGPQSFAADCKRDGFMDVLHSHIGSTSPCKRAALCHVGVVRAGSKGEIRRSVPCGGCSIPIGRSDS